MTGRVMRVLALDYGSARCGCAVSDPTGVLATPLEPVRRARRRGGASARLRALVREREVERVVVGLPLSLSGGDSAQTARRASSRPRLRGAAGGAGRALRRALHDALARAHGRERPSEDSRAAAHLLESWLASARLSGFERTARGARAGPARARARPRRRRRPGASRRARAARAATRRAAPAAHGRRPRRGPRAGASIVAALALVVVRLGGWFLIALFQPFKGDGHGRSRVDDPARATARADRRLLAERGVVASGFFFALRATLAGERGDLKPAPSRSART